jgi:hypothetical protein
MSSHMLLADHVCYHILRKDFLVPLNTSQQPFQSSYVELHREVAEKSFLLPESVQSACAAPDFLRWKQGFKNQCSHVLQLNYGSTCALLNESHTSGLVSYIFKISSVKIISLYDIILFPKGKYAHIITHRSDSTHQ